MKTVDPERRRIEEQHDILREAATHFQDGPPKPVSNRSIEDSRLLESTCESYEARRRI
jgi:hypothetical protein